MTESIGQTVHDEIAKRDGWARKWDDMSPVQKAAWDDGCAAAIAAQPKQGVRVKPLQWSKYAEAAGFDCKYMAYQTGDGWNCVKYPHGESQYRLAEGVSEAKARAAAQADYETRILSALEDAK